jgi:hypothetical protein
MTRLGVGALWRGVASTAILALGSCSQQRMMTSQARVVSAAEFQRLYEADRDVWQHADYLGKKNGYHYIAVFGLGWGDWVRYQYSIRTPTADLPASFPSIPQKPIKTLEELQKSRQEKGTTRPVRGTSP